MAEPTGLTIAVDLEEYSRFERDRDTITITFVASGGNDMSGEVITFSLMKARRDRDASVGSVNATIVGSSDPVTESVTLDLRDLIDSDRVSLLRRGYYFIQGVTQTSELTTADGSDFPVSIITAEQMKSSYLFGLELYAHDVRSVKLPPSNVTGVEIESMSQNHPMGGSTLTFVYNDLGGGDYVRQISWGAGPLVTINAPGRYLLRFDCTGSDYMIIRVRSLSALPTSNQTDDLFVAKDQISDDQLRNWVEQACDWWENDKVSVFLEPTRVVTDPTAPGGILIDYDFIVNPITFYPVIPARWIEILFPFPGLIRLDELFGQIANTRIVDVDLSWAEISERNGFVQLVPFNQEVAFQFIGLVWVESLRGVIELPNFWHYNAVAGLRDCDPVVREILAKKAGIDALTVAGQAFRGGFSSQSVSRDGVSESVSYTASAIYGIYSATIEDFNKFINREIKNLRGRYRGLNMLVC